MTGKDPLAGTPMDHVRRMEARRGSSSTDIIRARIAARERGEPEPRGEERTHDGRIRGGDLAVARLLDEEIAAGKPTGKGR